MADLSRAGRVGKAVRKRRHASPGPATEGDSPSSGRDGSTSRLPLAAAVSLVTFATYLPSLGNGFVNWDDGMYVVYNSHIQSLGARLFRWAFFDFYASNWHPLTWLSHALDYAVWRTNPLGHHLVNVILHAVNTFIVFFVVTTLLEAAKERRLQGASVFSDGRAIRITGTISALLFGLHPAHVESVAWVAERKDLLCGLFFLLSIAAYTRHVGSATGRSAPDRVVWPHRLSGSYLLSLLFFVLALLSKPMAVSLPLVLLILDGYPFRRISSFASFLSAVIEKIPFIAMSLGSVWLTVLAQGSESAMSLMEVVPLSTRLLVAAKAVVFYLLKMVLPLNLIPFYPYPLSASLRFPDFFVPVLLLIAISAFLVVTRGRNRAVLSIWTYYIVTLLPVLGIVQVGGQWMADRYTYLPSIGPFLLMGMAAAWGWTKASEKGGGAVRSVTVCAGVVLFFMMTCVTVSQIAIWKDSFRLWSRVIEKEPERAPSAYNNRGEALAAAGQIDRALADYDRAIALTDGTPALPKSGVFARIASSAYNNRGGIFYGMGLMDKAIKDFDRAIALDSSSYQSFTNRGAAFLAAGQLDNALGDYDTAIALNPNVYEARFGRGETFARKGMLDEAIADFDKAIELNPSRCEAFNSRGVAFDKKGEPERALEDFNRAILADKGCAIAYANRGNYYLKKGKMETAIAELQKACDLGNGHVCEFLKGLKK
ncbi:MAG TPA: tetratricopeptide repeat protein [Syntrophobacteria bacterium]|nr:tetratricopeptide repeat protein [Syntrophobacteria bacterium]